MVPLHAADLDDRFEVLPLGKSEQEAAELPERVRLTVTCSPKHGPDHSVAVAGRLHQLGHAVTVHIAARMVRDRAHVDELLAGMVAAGADELFLIGGDADPPVGAYRSAVELLPVIAEHPDRPRMIGIGGYPEGHPLIEPATLDQVLIDKTALADYVATQMCFDAATLRRWIVEWRQRGMTLPVYVGMPGQVSTAKLLELSARIGVGPSMAFLRKQRGLQGLLGLVRRSAPDRLHRALAPDVGDPSLRIAGFHYFTFNQLLATYEWHAAKQPVRGADRTALPLPYPRPEQSET